MRIGVYGDPHGGYSGEEGIPPSNQVHAEIVNALRYCDIIINLGDTSHNNSEEGWLDFEGTAWPILKVGKYFPVKGNHDGQVEWLNRYIGFYENNGHGCYYYLTLGDILIVFLEITVSKEEPPCNNPVYPNELVWLTNVLETHKDKPFKIVCYHTPPYTLGRRGANICARTMFQPILAAAGVDLVLCGHIHAYEHFKPGAMDILTFGGGGGPPHELMDLPPLPGVDNPVGVECYNYGIIEVIRAPNVARLKITAKDALTKETIDNLIIDTSHKLKPEKQVKFNRLERR